VVVLGEAVAGHLRHRSRSGEVGRGGIEEQKVGRRGEQVPLPVVEMFLDLLDAPGQDSQRPVVLLELYRRVVVPPRSFAPTDWWRACSKDSAAVPGPSGRSPGRDRGALSRGEWMP
jgi:hypothetical protein